MFGDRLLLARKSKNMTLEQLAEIYNKRFNGSLSKGTLSKYENNKQEPMITTVGNLALLLDVSTDFLLNGYEADIYSFDGISPIATKKIPMLGEIACGDPIYCNEEHELFMKINADINVDFCLTAKGDSMINARIFDGDIVFIKQQSMVQNGEIAAIIIDNEATLKRVYIKDDRIILRPENPLYNDLVYEKENMNKVIILGKAVAYQGLIR